MYVSHSNIAQQSVHEAGNSEHILSIFLVGRLRHVRVTGRVSTGQAIRQSTKYPYSKMKNQTIILNDFIIEYSLKGEGNTSIVFINGFRMPLDSWNMLYPSIEKVGKVFVYNRFGIGYSSKAMSDQTGTTVVETLRNLLQVVDLSPHTFWLVILLGEYLQIYMPACILKKCQELCLLTLLIPMNLKSKTNYNSTILC